MKSPRDTLLPLRITRELQSYALLGAAYVSRKQHGRFLRWIIQRSPAKLVIIFQIQASPISIFHVNTGSNASDDTRPSTTIYIYIYILQTLPFVTPLAFLLLALSLHGCMIKPQLLDQVERDSEGHPDRFGRNRSQITDFVKCSKTKYESK